MGLITPAWGWKDCTVNFTGTPSQNPGTVLTAGATANTDGASVSLISALAHDCEFLVIGVITSAVTSVNSGSLLDILIDPAGGTSWNTDPLINDLLVGYCQPLGGFNNSPSKWYFFPIWIKSGTSIGARVRSANASNSVRVVVWAQGGNSHPANWWCGQSVTEIGITAGSSRGQLHTSGNSGAYSAWTDLGSTLPAPCGALQFGHQGGAITAQNTLVYHLEFGVGANRIGPPLWTQGDTNERMCDFPLGFIPCSLKAGEQLQVRGTCSGTAQALDVAAYAVH